jgi:hypothetical protein
MFDRVKPAVFTFLHAVLGTKIASSPGPQWVPVVLPVFPEPIVTYTWRMAAVRKGDGIALLRNWRVTCVRAYKSKAASRHEYISATVVDSENNLTSHVAFERLRGDPSDSNHIDPNTEPNIDSIPPGLFSASTRNSSSLSLSSSSDSIAACVASDRIAPIPPPGTWDKSDELIYELKFEGRPLYLYELAILAAIVHEKNAYLLMANNCYYFAGTIMKALQEEYRTVNTADGAGAERWCGVLLYPGKKDGNTSFLLEKVREGIKNFVRFLY